MQGVRINRGDEHFTGGDGRRAETTSQFLLPDLLEVGGNFGRGRTAPAGVMSIGRPIGRAGGWAMNFPISGPFFQTGLGGKIRFRQIRYAS